MTKEEKIICKDFLNDADKTHSCNEYKLLMALLEQEPRWIPVSERLPKDRGFYLVSTTDCITIMEFINGWISQNIGLCNGYVTAWMPLPKAYREVE